MDFDRFKENREDFRIVEFGFDGEDVEVCVEDYEYSWLSYRFLIERWMLVNVCSFVKLC